MSVLRTLLICILFLHGALGVAQADRYEIRQQKGLLVFEGFQQWLDLRYSYRDHVSILDGQKSSTVLHAFRESYNASLSAAIYDPHIFDTTLQVGIVFDQNRGRYDAAYSSVDTATYQYNFTGSGLDMSPTPFTLRSYRELNTIENTYSLPYTSQNSGNEVDFAIRNGFLPSRLHLSQITLDTTGGGQDSSSVSNSYSYIAEHAYKDLSVTVLQLRFSEQSGRSSSSADVLRTSNTMTISNSLSVGEQKKYSLLTWFNLYNSRSAIFPQRTIELRETLVGQLGKALSLEAVGDIAKSRSIDDSGLSQESTSSRGEVTLRHKLFSSVETILNGAASSNKMDGGIEDRYSGRVGINYVKHLPKSSVLSLGVTKEYELVDRKIDSATVRVSEELHSSVHQGDVIDLPLGDATLISVVSVKSRNPDVTYDEGFDYTVNIPFGRITIGAGIGVRIDTAGGGTDLYVTYLVTKSPVTKYSSDVISVSSSLTLLDNKLRLGASYIELNRSLVSNIDLSNGLGFSRTAMVFVSGKYENYNARISFRDYINEKLASRSIEGNGGANWNYGPSSFSVALRDRYYNYDSSSVAAAYSENMADVSLSYSRNILSNMRLNLMANALDVRSDVRDTRDSMSFRALFKIVLNKSVLTFSGQSVWLLYKNETSRDNAVRVDYTRNL